MTGERGKFIYARDPKHRGNALVRYLREQGIATARWENYPSQTLQGLTRFALKFESGKSRWDEVQGRTRALQADQPAGHGSAIVRLAENARSVDDCVVTVPVPVFTKMLRLWVEHEERRGG